MNSNESVKKWLIFIALIFLIFSVLTTSFYGNTDTYDYSNVAKLFSGDFNAKIRTSHSFLYGFIHYPLVDLMDSFFIFKISSLIFLGLIVYSTYIISGRNKKALLLSVFSPIVWFMAPWISPIQLASLLFIWGYYFIKKYELSSKLGHLFYSGALIGISWAFWDGVLFFIPLFAISFLYNKKLSHFLIFLISIFIGIIPRLIIDQILFGFAFQGILRHIMATLSILFYGGFSGNTLSSRAMSLILLFFIPWFSYIFAKKEVFKSNKKEIYFLSLSLIILFINSQIRMLLLFYPIIIILLSKNLTEKSFNKQLSIFIIISLIVVLPYFMQLDNNIGNLQGQDIGSLIAFNIDVKERFSKEVISADLKKIGSEYPNQVFLVGNEDDSYASLSNVYWGEDIKEFVSIQDYRIFMSGDPVISKKTICTNNKIYERRDFCATILIRNSFSDKTDYNSINYAISDKKDLSLEGFEFVKKYESLYLFRKTN